MTRTPAFEPQRGTPTSESLTSAQDEYLRDLTADQQRTATTQWISGSFDRIEHTMNRRLDTLAGDIDKEAQPAWYESFVIAALQVALGSGEAAVGKYFALKTLGTATAKAKPVLEEVVKNLFKGGAAAGVSAGKDAFLKGASMTVAQRFVEGHRKGASALLAANRQRFIFSSQFRLATADLKTISDSCTPEHEDFEADLQYEGARDAWVAFVAQAQFGSRGTGPDTRTNVATQADRDEANEWVPGSMPAVAPNIVETFMGSGAGVLEVVAQLPAHDGARLDRPPHVEVAVLNGVNEGVRRQYSNKLVGELAIPRQLVCQVEGEQPSFEVNLDERGGHTALDYQHATWLRARAMSGPRENAALSDHEKTAKGLSLLLGELMVGIVTRRG